MRFTSVIFIGFVAIAYAEAIAYPEPAPDAKAVSQFCNRSDQPCSKMKRAAEAVADALAEPAPVPEAEAEAARHVWCWRPGQPCNKAKRDALAIANAFAEAAADPGMSNPTLT